MNIQKNLTDTNARLKNCCMQKGIAFFIMVLLRNFIWARESFIWIETETLLLQKIIASYKQKRLILFTLWLSYCVNHCLSDTLEKANSDVDFSLQTLRKGNFNKLIFAYLKINSIRNKFDSVADTIIVNIDILRISEDKFDNSSPDRQFFLNGFRTPFRLDLDRNVGGIMLFIRNDIPTKVESHPQKHKTTKTISNHIWTVFPRV